MKRRKLTIKEKIEMYKAVRALGYHYRGQPLSFEPVGIKRWAVWLHNEWLGIYDLDRHTFVD